MVQRSVKRSAVRVRWEFSDTPYGILRLQTEPKEAVRMEKKLDLEDTVRVR